MELITLKCPNCSGIIEIEDGLDTCYCKYCGYKVVIEGQSNAAYRAKTKMKRMEHDERMQAQKFEHERYKIETENKKANKHLIIGICAAIAFVLFYVAIFGGVKLMSNKQERELQALVDEIHIDIENEDFDEAYIKAQSIKYTVDWSKDIEKKWDNIRKEVINQIIEAEKAATGKSNHKPEKDGLFDWFTK